MTAANDTASRRPRNPVSGKNVLDVAAYTMRDVVTLLQTELELLRAEISEKLTFIAYSIAFIGAGALLLAATLVLTLQAAIAGLIAYGAAPSLAILVVAGAALVVGVALVWVGIQNLSLNRLTPTKTVRQIKKNAALTKAR